MNSVKSTSDDDHRSFRSVPFPSAQLGGVNGEVSQRRQLNKLFGHQQQLPTALRLNNINIEDEEEEHTSPHITSAPEAPAFVLAAVFLFYTQSSILSKPTITIY